MGHVAICVKNIPQAINFYRTLGMELAWQDQDWAYLKAGQDGLALLGPDYRGAGPHFGFTFRERAELDQHHRRLKGAGILVGEIHDHRDGTASFYSKDLDNNTIEFLYEPDPQA